MPPFATAVCLGELDAVRPPSSWHTALHVDAASLWLGASLPGLLLPPSSAAAFSPAVKIAGCLRGKVNSILGGLRVGKNCPQRGGWICGVGHRGPARQSRTRWSIGTGRAAGGSQLAVKGGSCCGPHQPHQHLLCSCWSHTGPCVTWGEQG